MKYALLSTLLIFITLTSYSQIGSGNSWSEVKQAGKGNVNIIYYETPGIIKKNANGTTEGLCVDIIKDFKKHIKTTYDKDVTFNYIKKADAWTSFLSNVKNSKKGVLGVGNVTITDARKKSYEFTPSFMNNPMMFITHKNAPTLKSFDNMKTTLSGYTAKVVEGSTHLSYMSNLKKEYYPELNIIFGDSGVGIVDDIAKNDKLFTIVDFTEFFYVTKKKLPIKRHALSISNTKEILGMIMPKGSDWSVIWSEFLTKEYKKSPRYREIITKNFGSQFTYLID